MGAELEPAGLPGIAAESLGSRRVALTALTHRCACCLFPWAVQSLGCRRLQQRSIRGTALGASLSRKVTLSARVDSALGFFCSTDR